MCSQQVQQSIGLQDHSCPTHEMEKVISSHANWQASPAELMAAGVHRGQDDKEATVDDQAWRIIKHIHALMGEPCESTS